MTQALQHTPGPWQKLQDEVSRKFFIFAGHSQPFGDDVCYGIKNEADADVIAAAPTMANVLVELREILSANADRYEVELHAIDLTLEQAGIAKARGQ